MMVLAWLPLTASNLESTVNFIGMLLLPPIYLIPSYIQLAPKKQCQHKVLTWCGRIKKSDQT